jgi:hypothetical protein
MTLGDVGPDNWRHCAALEVEMTLLIYPVVVGQGTPVVVGQGTRLFPDTGPDLALDLGRIAVDPKRGNDPGLPAHRAPAVRNGHARPAHPT